MNVDTSSKITSNSISAPTPANNNNNSSNNSTSFSEELKTLSSQQTKEKTETEKQATENDGTQTENNPETETNVNDTIDGLETIVAEVSEKLNRTDEKISTELKKYTISDDNTIKKEDNGLINNEMNVQELKDALAFQMNASMNFNSDDQPFSEFMNNEQSSNLQATQSDLAEEKAILSTMEENMAIADRNKAMAVKTVMNNEGVKKVDLNSNITVETVVKFDEILVSKADVDFFTNLVENGSVEMTQETAKSAGISKTLADMIAKSMKDNQPIRINFDNDISVIIKISRDGKISADFLPSSQVAEAYLKENLPLLKQKFDDNNIEYDSLNQRRQKQDEKENQKKGRKDE